MNEIPENTPVSQRQVMSLMDFRAIEAMPQDVNELIPLYGNCCDSLHVMFMRRFTESERDALRANDPNMTRVFNDRLDDFAIDAAEQVGAPWVYFYPLIATRMIQWRNGTDKDGLRKLQRFHKAVELAASVARGEKTGSVTLAHREFFKAVKQEVKTLFSDLNKFLAKNRGAVTPKDVVARAEQTIKDNPNAYQKLTEVLSPFLIRLEHILSERIRNRQPINDKLPTETRFVAQWMATALGRTESGFLWELSMVAKP